MNFQRLSNNVLSLIFLLLSTGIDVKALHFEQNPYLANVTENQNSNYVVFLTVMCIGIDDDELIYSLGDEMLSVPFGIYPDHGGIYTTANLDYEDRTFYSFDVICEPLFTDHETNVPVLPATASVEITVQPVNEYKPTVVLTACGIDPNVLQINETQLKKGDLLVSPIKAGASIFINASDKDAGKDGVLTFALSEPKQAFQLFSIDATTGDVTIKTQQLDADVPGTAGFRTMNLSINASDSSKWFNSNKVLINISAVNDNLPRFAQHLFSVSIPENDGDNNTIETIVANASCTDGDIGEGQLDCIKFLNPSAQVQELFVIKDPKLGIIILNNSLDYEKVQAINFTLECVDEGDNSDTATVSVTVQACNDHLPRFVQHLFSVSIPENDGDNEMNVANASCIDGDIGKGQLDCIKFLNPSTQVQEHFVIKDPKLGIVILNNSLDYEKIQAINFTLVCVDEGNNRDTATVSVTVQARNDNLPRFVNHSFSASIPENVNNYTIVANASCTDKDIGEGQLDCIKFLNPSTQVQEHFVINDTKLGTVILKEALDYEKIQAINFTLECVDEGNNRDTATVSVTIQAHNDNLPRFADHMFSVTIPESDSNTTGMIVANASCSDGDIGKGQLDGIKFLSPSAQVKKHFVIAYPKLGIVILNNTLDYEKIQAINFTLECVDEGNNRDTATVSVTVQARNDNLPRFAAPKFSMTIPENDSNTTGMIVANASCTDGDIGKGQLDGIKFLNASALVKKHFVIADPKLGIVILNNTLDYEKIQAINFTLECVDEGNNRDTATVCITVQARNDNLPRFAAPKFSMTILENDSNTTGMIVVNASCTDGDIGKGQLDGVKFLNPSALVKKHFVIADPKLGIVVLNNTLDYEKIQAINFTLECVDEGNNRDTATVCITVQARNDNLPRFVAPKFLVTIPENDSNTTGMIVANASCTDGDIGKGQLDGIKFLNPSALVKKHFVIADPKLGIVILNNTLDFEKIQAINFTLECVDEGNNRDTATVCITVQARNDNLPRFADHMFFVTIPENDSNTTGMIVANASCTDGDSGKGQLDGIKFLNPSALVKKHFVIADPKLGIVILNNTLDYEKIQAINFTLECVDEATNRDTATVSITVQARNDNRPMFKQNGYNFSLSQTTPIWSSIGKILATDKDKDIGGELQYSIEVNPYFSINMTSGTIHLMKSPQIVNQYFSLFTVNVTDGFFSVSTLVNFSFTDGNFIEPKFINKIQIYNVSLCTPVGSELFIVQCNDTEQGLNGLISYYIVSGNTGNILDINTTTGAVFLANLLTQGENQSNAQYFVTFRCSDHGVPVYSDEMSVLVDVFQDNSFFINDNDNVVAFIDENASFGTVVVTLCMTAIGNEVMYTLHNLTVPKAFQVNSKTGKVVVTSILDREMISTYSMTITATEVLPEDQINSISANLTIYVQDINDNLPICDVFATSIDVDPGLAVGSMIFDLSCSDADAGQNANISYSLDDNFGVLDIHANGSLFLLGSLEQANKSVLILRVLVADMGTPVLSTQVNILLRILSKNDHIPVITNLPMTLEISESVSVFSLLFQVTAEDLDKGVFGIVRFHLENESILPFTLIQNTGELFVTSKLNFYTQEQYILHISAFDPQHTVFSNLTVFVLDANEFSPQCDSTIISKQIPEAIAPHLVSTIPISCSDGDIGSFGDLSYEIISGNINNTFSINPSGVVQVTKVLDYEMAEQYTLAVLVSDNGSPSHTQSVIINIEVSPSNEFTPVVANSSYSISIVEGISIGSTILQLMASDGDKGSDGELTFLLNPTQSTFTIHSQGDIQIKGTVDREKQSNYSFTIQVIDGGTPAKEVEVPVIINVIDIDDSKPKFTESLYVASLTPDEAVVGGPVLTVECTDPDIGENSDFIYQLPLSEYSNFYSISPSGIITISQEILLGGTHSFPVWCLGKLNQAFNDTAHVSATIQINSNITFFAQNGTYIVTLNESFAPIQSFIDINATSTTESSLTYNFINSPSIFSIEDDSGIISLIGHLDYEMTKSYTLVVEASDENSPPNSGQAVVFVFVLNANDETPQFTSEPEKHMLVEGQTYATVAQYQCTDGDDGEFGTVTYSIGTGNTNNTFFVDSESGIVQLNTGTVDYNTAQSFSLQLICKDGGDPARMDSVILPIFILPVNEHPPVFSTPSTTVAISESLIVPTILNISIQATDQDAAPHNNIWYTITEGNQMQKFDIFHSTGYIVLIQPLDFESVKEFSLTVKADDSGGLTVPGYPVLNSTIEVNILVTDVNDHTPVFNQSTYSGVIDECASIGDLVVNLQFACTDDDSGSNAATVLSIDGGNTENAFSIQSNGRVRVENTLDFESLSSYILTIRCADQGNPARSNDVTAVINIKDCSEFGPVFNQTSYQFSISEDSLPGSKVGQVLAIDQDGGDTGKVTYSFNNDTFIPFGIHSDTGVIFITQPLDYETQVDKTYFISVNATDSANQTDSVVIAFNLINIDDNMPTFTQYDYFGTIRENSALGTTVSLINQVACSDADDAADGVGVTYALPSSNLPLLAEGSTGILTSLGELDTETKSRYIFNLTCRDSDGNDAMATITIDILPFNDFPPKFIKTQYTVTLVENSQIGSILAIVNATDFDVIDYNTITYGIVESNGASLFTIEPITGQITVQQIVDYEQYTQIILNISASNVIPADDTSGSPQLTGYTNMVINVTDKNDNSPVLSPVSFIIIITDVDVPGTVVTHYTCTDADSGLNGETSIILNGPNTKNFTLLSNGTLVTATPILSDLVVQIECTDKGDPPNEVSTILSVESTSSNDYSPTFLTNFSVFYVLENHTVGAEIGCITATDADGPLTADGIVHYSLQLVAGTNLSNRFDIDKNTGCLFVSLTLNYNEENHYEYSLIASDRGVPIRKSAIQVIINIVNTFIDPPEFVGGPYTRNLSEDVEVNTIVTTEPRCIDQDHGENFSYSIVSGNSNNHFFISNTTGVIVLSNTLDFETSTKHTLVIRCTDSSGLVDEENVYVTVTPVNEYTPILTQVNVTFTEQSLVGTPVTNLAISDGDAGLDGKVSITINSNNTDLFTVTPTGTLLVNALLDREQKKSHNVSFYLIDNSLNPVNRRSSTNWIIVELTDINDNVPQALFNNNTGLFKFGPVNATAPSGHLVGAVQCSDVDTGVNAALTYSIENNMLFSMNTSGKLFVSGDLRNRDFDNVAVTAFCADGGIPQLQVSFTIVVEVFELNIHHPMFLNSMHFVSLPENFSTFTPFLNVTAIDNDVGVNGHIHYRLLHNFENLFFVSTGTGSLQLLLQLDFEKETRYNLVIEALDAASDSEVRFTASTNVTIEVTGVNEHTPVCSQPIYTAIISASSGGEVLKINCTDSDQGIDGDLVYVIANGSNHNKFTISDLGTISIPTPIPPNFSTEIYEITIVVADRGLPSRQTKVTGAFVYSFENLHNPQFAESQYSVSIPESTPVGSVVLTVTALDFDFGFQGEVKYLLNGTLSFSVNPKTGEIFVSENLDAETMQQITFEVIASDSDPLEPQSNTTTVNITLTDVNDNTPYCTSQHYIVSIGSSAANGTTLLTLQELCMDDDVMFSQLTYSLVENGSFFIAPSTGQLSVAGALTSGSTVALVVVINDNGSPSLSTTITVIVQVWFENTQPPIFSSNKYNFNISEGVALLQSVGYLNAIDPDSPPSDLKFSLGTPDFDNLFYIEPISGEVKVTGSLDFETTTQYVFMVKVHDAGGFNGTNPLSSAATVNVNVLNINDHLPVLSNGGFYSATVNKTTTINSVVVSIMCTDVDLPPYGNPTLDTHDFTASMPFSLMQTEENWVVQVSQNLMDISGSMSYAPNITCTDQGGQSVTGQVFLFVPDIGAPFFLKSPYTWSVPENTTVGIEFSEVQASSLSVSLTYTIENGNADGLFYINPNSGTVSLAGSLDYEAQTQHALVIKVVDSMKRQSSVLLLVQVQDVNDEVPLISPSATFQLEQSREVGFPIGQLACTDGDILSNATQINFNFVTPTDTFSIDNNGIIRLEAPLDSTPVYVLPTNCYDVSQPEIVSIGIVSIQILFLNQHMPQFEFKSYETSISEGAALQTVVITVNAIDSDVGSFGDLSYSITGGNNLSKFFIDPHHGQISVITFLDREEKSVYTLTVEAVDGGPSANESTRRTGTTTVTVNVLDTNDNKPMLDQASYVHTILTNHSILTRVFQVNCSDSDLSENGTVNFISPPHPDFIVTSEGLVLLSSQQTDQTVHNFYITCHDMGAMPLSSSSLVTIVINKLDFAAPVFTMPAYNVSIPEDLPILSTLVQVNASTISTSGGIKYSIISGNTGNMFSINSLSGDIFLLGTLNYIHQSQYTLTVQASTTEFISKSALATVSIMLKDVNNNAPVFSSPFYTGNVTEAVSMVSPVVQLNCSDEDPTDTLTYTIISGLIGGYSTAFLISPEGLIILQQLLDYEDKAVFILQVQCSDGASSPANATVRIDVLPVNEFKPTFSMVSYQFSVKENTAVGTLLGSVNATDSDAGIQGVITYLLPNDIVNVSPVLIAPSTGDIFISNLLDYETMTSHNLSVIAKDHGDLSTYVLLEIIVLNENDVAPLLTPSISVADRLLLNSPKGFFVQSYTCTDLDGGNTNITISGGNDLGYFALDNFNRLVWTGTSPNITSDVVVSLTLLCTDIANQTETAHIHITIGPPDKIIPIFSQIEYLIDVAENATVGTQIVQVMATTNSSGIICYSFVQTYANFPFSINNVTGSITVNDSLSRETTSFFSFSVLAMDNTEHTSALTTINVVILDVNDNPPVIAPKLFSITLFEDATIDTAYAKYVCSDADEGLNGQVSFSILGGSPPGFFNASAGTGHIILQQPLDFEFYSSYNITVACSDHGSPPLISTADFFVSVVGVNEFWPMFDRSSYNFTVPETLLPTSTFGQVTANDDDNGVNGMFHFEVLESSGEEFFLVDSTTGDLKVKQILNATENSKLDFAIAAIDYGPYTSFTSSVVVSVFVEDVNSPPNFDQAGYIVIVPTTNAVNESILSLICFDTDLAQNAHVSMMVTSNDLNDSISLQTIGNHKSIVGSLSTNIPLTVGSYELVILCSDSGSPNLEVTASVTVIVQGSNVGPPVFNSSLYAYSLNEDTPLGTSLLTVQAIDDTDTVVSYSITAGTGAGTFYIEPNTGIVTLSLTLDYETTTNYFFTVSATDNNPVNQLTGTTQVSIIVENVNDNLPIITPQSAIVVVSEEQLAGSVIQTYLCSDADGTPVFLSIVPSFAPFTINASGTVQSTEMLDYEENTSYALTVICMEDELEGVQHSSTVSLSVLVQPVNFHPPHFTSSLSFSVAENTTVGTTIGTITAVDPDNRGLISYSTNSYTDLFNLNPTTGAIVLLSSLDCETMDEYMLVITANDGDNIPGDVQVTPKTNTTAIIISVTDVNDNVPICIPTVVSVTILEGQYNDSLTLFNASCVDDDIGLNGEVRYYLVESLALYEGDFYLNNMTGELIFTGKITTASSTGVLQIQVQDLGTLTDTNHITSPVIIQIIITVLSASTPFFEPDGFNVTISENHLLLSLVYNGSQLVSALHNTMDQTLLFSLSISSSVYVVDVSTGNIFLTSKLDYDSGPQVYPLTIRADVGDLAVETIVTVYLTDYNDNPPKFTAQFYNVTVTENQPSGTVVAQIFSTDADSGVNALVNYSISGSDSTDFKIDSKSGQITSLIELDRESVNYYSFTVTCLDHGVPSLTSTALVSLSIGDVNDNPPRFPLRVYPISVSNIETIGNTLFTFSVLDPDVVGTHRFELVTNDWFIESILQLDPVTGALILKAQLTGEYEPRYTFYVRVDDELHVDTATIIFTIFEVTTAEFSIIENSFKSFDLFDIIQLSSFDIADDSTCFILSGDPYDQFNVTSDGILENTVPLDRENISVYTLQVGVLDNSSSIIVNIMVYITVQDENDNTPIFRQVIYQFTISEQNYETRTVIGQVNATDGDDPATSNGHIKYSIFELSISPQFEQILPIINSTTGEISIIGLVDRESYTNYAFAVQASDFGKPKRSSSSEVEILVADVNDRAPVFEPQNVEGYWIFYYSGAEAGTIANKTMAYFLDGCNKNYCSIEVDEISFSDVDVNDNVTASISTNEFTLTNYTSPLQIVSNISLSYMFSNGTTFFITITDAAGHQAYKPVTVIVKETLPVTTTLTSSTFMGTAYPSVATIPPTNGTEFYETPLGIAIIALGGFLSMAIFFFVFCVLCYAYQFYQRKKEIENQRPYSVSKRLEEQGTMKKVKRTHFSDLYYNTNMQDMYQMNHTAYEFCNHEEYEENIEHETQFHSFYMEVNRKGKGNSFIDGTKETLPNNYLQNNYLPTEKGTDFQCSGNRKHQYGPVLQMMLNEFFMGDELLRLPTDEVQVHNDTSQDDNI